MARSRRRPAPVTPAIIDVRVLLVTAVVASPAAYRASQGLLTVDQALTRFLLVLVACTAVTALLRAVWPVVAGEPTAEPARVDEAEQQELSPPPG